MSAGGLGTETALSNWGRFGADDEVGTLNFLDAAAVLQAVTTVSSGEYFPLNLPMDEPAGIGFGRPEFSRVQFRQNEEIQGMVCNDDYGTMSFQGSSQWDALIHAGLNDPDSEGVFYNGAKPSDVDAAGYAHKNGIDKVAQRGIVGRGILLDIARMQADGGDDPLPLDFVITEDIVRACLEHEGLDVGPGAVVCFRTGWTETYLQGDADERARLMVPADELGHVQCPGISASLAAIAHEQSWAAVTADNLAMDATPVDGGWSKSAHISMMRNLGISIGELFYYERLSKACAADRRWDFLFVSVPLWIPGGSGSPSCAIAIR